MTLPGGGSHLRPIILPLVSYPSLGGYPSQVRSHAPSLARYPGHVRGVPQPIQDGGHFPGQVRMGVPPMQIRTAGTLIRSRWGYPQPESEWDTSSLVRMGVPPWPGQGRGTPWQDKPWTFSAAVGTPLAVSHSRTFLF